MAKRKPFVEKMGIEEILSAPIPFSQEQLQRAFDDKTSNIFDCDEHYLVDAIKRHLLTEKQRKHIYDKRSSIEDMLNGRVEDDDWTDAIYAEWNKKIGKRTFGFGD